MPKQKVYIAGPYTSDPEPNTRKACILWKELLELGFTPFCPHWSHCQQTVSPEMDLEDWLAFDFEWLAECDYLIRLPGFSPGSAREEAFARTLGIPVVHTVGQLLALSTGKPALAARGGA